MKFRSFRIAAALAVLGAVGGGIAFAVHKLSGSSAPPPAASPPASAQPTAPPAPAAPSQLPVPNAELKAKLEAFLSAHPHNDGRDRWDDCIPDAPFRATAVKFNAADHERYSSKDQTLWSQIRIDFDRNGIDDAKVLLKDGHVYKLERLGPDGKQVIGAPEYFK